MARKPIPHKVRAVALDFGVHSDCIVAIEYDGNPCKTCWILLQKAFDTFYHDVPVEDMAMTIELDLLMDTLEA